MASFYCDVYTALLDVGEDKGRLWTPLDGNTWWEIPMLLENVGVAYSIPNSRRSTIEGNHVSTSNHFHNRGIDLVGGNENRSAMTPIKDALRPYAAAGLLCELYYNDGTSNFQYGRRIGDVTNHYNHVHAALYRGIHLPINNPQTTSYTYPQSEEAMQSPQIPPGGQWPFDVLIGPAKGGGVHNAYLGANFPTEKGGVADWSLNDTNGAVLQFTDARNGRPGYFQVTPNATKATGVINVRDMAGRPDKGEGKRVISAWIINTGHEPCVATLNPFIEDPA